MCDVICIIAPQIGSRAKANLSASCRTCAAYPHLSHSCLRAQHSTAQRPPLFNMLHNHYNIINFNSSQVSVRNSPKLIFGPIDRLTQTWRTHRVDQHTRVSHASAGPHLVAIDNFLLIYNLPNVHLQAPPFSPLSNKSPNSKHENTPLFPFPFFPHILQTGREALARTRLCLASNAKLGIPHGVVIVPRLLCTG